MLGEGVLRPKRAEQGVHGLLGRGGGFGLFQRGLDSSEMGKDLRCLGMFRPQGGTGDAGGAQQKRLSLLWAIQCGQVRGEVRENNAERWMLRAECLLDDGMGLAE